MLHVRSTISSVSGSSLGWFLATEVLWVRVLTSGGLGNVWLNRHAAWDDVGSHTTTGCILGCSRSTESLGQLLDQGLSNIVHSNVHSVSNTKDHQGAFSGEGQA